MENETNNWLKNEKQKLEEQQKELNYEELPSFKLEQNKMYQVLIDFSKPFEKWIDSESGVVKKIIPLTYNGERMNFWLNTRNPLYKQLIDRGAIGQTSFVLTKTGEKSKTRYNIIEK